MTGTRPISPPKKQAVVYAALSRDRCIAELVIPAQIDRSSLTLRQCLDAIEDKHIPVDQSVITTVRTAMDAPPSGEREDRYVIAKGRCPTKGIDGRIEWLIHSGYEAPEDTLEPVDHYDRASLPLVETDQVMGRIIPPTAGIDGADVYNKPIKAEPGREVTLSHDETIRMDSDKIVACACGLLEIKAGRAGIREMIDIKGNVDFSTGHVEYKRDIRVRGGVGDRFHVKAGGHLVVEGLTEAANIETGGNFEARGGMVGYPNGAVRIGGNLVAKYLDSVTGHITGDLRVEREVIHCDLRVLHDVDISNGAIIGGSLTANAAVHIGMLGSGAGIDTKLKSTAIGKALDLNILRKLHPGVTLIVGAQRYYFNRLIRGPIRITRGDDGVIMLSKSGGKPAPLTMITGVS